MLFWHLNDCFECCDTYELYHKFLLLEQLFLTTLMKPATKFEETKDMYSTGYQSIKTELYKNTSSNLNQKLAMLAKSMFSIP